MEISIVIPTYKRPAELKECLNSVIRQTKPPKEILVIDNADDEASKKIVGEISAVAARYVRNEKENSLTGAKNLGAEKASGDIVLFLDDDMTITKNYLEELLSVYQTHPEAVGVEGYIEAPNTKLYKFSNLIGRLFFLGHRAENQCRILPSIKGVYPGSLNSPMNCEWLSGVSSWKKEILAEFKFDENLKKYSDSEDLDFSYRVHKKYPRGLFIAPRALMRNKEAEAGRPALRELALMTEIYNLYLFYKNFDQTLKNKLIFLWSRVGKFIFNLLAFVYKLSPNYLKRNVYLVEGWFLAIKHRKEIKAGNLEFFNKTLR